VVRSRRTSCASTGPRLDIGGLPTLRDAGVDLRGRARALHHKLAVGTGLPEDGARRASSSLLDRARGPEALDALRAKALEEGAASPADAAEIVRLEERPARRVEEQTRRRVEMVRRSDASPRRGGVDSGSPCGSRLSVIQTNLWST